MANKKTTNRIDEAAKAGMDVPVRKCLDLAISLAKEAGSIMRRSQSSGMNTRLKADKTVVTDADIEINRRVISSVKRTFPDHDVLAEEESDLSRNSNKIWVCDPIDGTLPFTLGLRVSVFSLALVIDGMPVLGVVYDPFSDRLFSAVKGEGAFLNGKPIRVSKASEIAGAVIGISIFKNGIVDLAKVPGELVASGANMLNLGSTTAMGAMVAAGTLDANIFPGSKSHDTAALKVIVEEAGGRVTDIFGNEQRYDRDIRGSVTSNGLLHDKLIEIIGRSLAQQS